MPTLTFFKILPSYSHNCVLVHVASPKEGSAKSNKGLARPWRALRQASDGYIIAKLVFGNFIGLRRLFLPEYLVYFVVFATAVEYQVILFRPAELT
jgi:hypothetical protein